MKTKGIVALLSGSKSTELLLEGKLRRIEALHELVLRFRMLQELKELDRLNDNPLIRMELLALYGLLDEEI